MELSILADQYLGSNDGVDLTGAGAHTNRLHDLVLHETVTTPLASTVFWQASIGSSQWSNIVMKAGASPIALSQGQMYVVSHGDINMGFPQYDLVIFDPGLADEKVRSADLVIKDTELRQGWQQYIGSLAKRVNDMPTVTDRVMQFGLNSELAVEAARSRNFRFMIVKKPEIEFLSVPSPALDINNVTSRSTAGIIAQNKQGQWGVTAALHAISNQPGNINVGNYSGNIISTDHITDSAFIEVPGINQYSSNKISGPLSGMTPRAYQNVSFEGIQSGSIQTTITAWSHELPIVMPGAQLTVLTKPDTNPGDSGAALVDDDNVIGFAFYRTGFNSSPEFSSWIWAESVYQAHDLI